MFFTLSGVIGNAPPYMVETTADDDVTLLYDDGLLSPLCYNLFFIKNEVKVNADYAGFRFNC